MGHDHQQSSSSGAVVAIVVAVLLVGIIGLLAVVGVGLFFVRTTSSNYSRAVDIAEANRAVAEELRAKGEAIQAVVQEQRAEATPQNQESRAAATPGPRLNIEVQLDRVGNASVDGEKIGLDELRKKLAKLKDETSNAFSVRIDADPECPAKHIITVLDVCEEGGDIDYRIVSSENSAVQVTATVAAYERAAEWDHFDDGTFSAYDKITLKVLTPERHAGTTFSVTVPPTELPEDSALRAAGTRFIFMVRESYIGATGLAWGAIGDPTLERHGR